MIRLQLGEYRAHKIVLKQRSVDHAAVKMDNVDINAARRVFAARRPTDTTLDTFHIALQLSQADAALDNQALINKIGLTGAAAHRRNMPELPELNNAVTSPKLAYGSRHIGFWVNIGAQEQQNSISR